MFCDGAALHPATVAAQSMADTTIGDLIRRTGDIGARSFLRNRRKPIAVRIILGAHRLSRARRFMAKSADRAAQPLAAIRLLR
jgi:hypothetical protein